MSAVLVTAVFHPREGRKQELADAMRRGIEAVHTESGCELYSIHDAEDGTITMIEKWSSVEELDTHGDGEPVKTLLADIEELVEGGPTVTRMYPLPRGTAEQGTL